MRNKVVVCLVSFLGGIFVFSQILFAELDPELAQTQKGKRASFDVGANVGFGLSSSSEGGNSALFYMFGIEGSYLNKNLSLEFLEVGLEFGFANASFKKDDNSFSESIFPFFLPKIGFVQSFEDNVYGVLGIGAGFGLTKYTVDTDSGTYDSSSAAGFMLKLSYKFKIHVKESKFKLAIGPEWNYVRSNFEKIKKDGVVVSDITGMSLNIFNVVFGVQVEL